MVEQNNFAHRDESEIDPTILKISRTGFFTFHLIDNNGGRTLLCVRDQFLFAK